MIAERTIQYPQRVDDRYGFRIRHAIQVEIIDRMAPMYCMSSGSVIAWIP